MDYTQKPRLTIFTNKYAGSPIKRKDGTFVTDSKGNPIKQGNFNGKINLPEGLSAGDYEVSIYKAISKTGDEYMSGTIKKAYVRQEISEHSKAKGDGFAPQVNRAEEEDDQDEIPF